MEQQQADSLQGQANTLANAVASLDAQIATLQDQINVNQLKYSQLQDQIATNNAALAQKKQALADAVEQIYLEQAQSPLETLVSSPNLSDFFNQQQYQDTVKTAIQSSMAAVVTLQAELTTESQQVSQLLANQRGMQSTLSAQQSQEQQLLASTQGQESVYQSQVSQQSAQVKKLQQEQIAAEQAAGAPAAGTGAACGGGYPGSARNSAGLNWGCNYAQDNTYDNWYEYNRECVSYTAWAMSSRGYFVPYGMGNAIDWPASARSAGIRTGGEPAAGSYNNVVAIWSIAPYGHAMVVNSVNGDGSINVSQYNYGFNGNYSTMTVDPSLASSFTYIYF